MPSAAAPRSNAVLFRRLRAITGVYLLIYVTFHLLNLSLGLISIEVMDAARPYLSGVMTGPVLSWILMSALLVHYLLGLKTIYERPSLTGTIPDLLQALSGLLVIPLMAIHVIGILVLKTYNVEANYALVNRIFWLDRPALGLTQVILISVVWVHGCAGLFMGLRARAGAAAFLPWIYPLAVAVPVVALLGYAQAGQIVMAQGVGASIVQFPNPDGTMPDPVPYLFTTQITNWTIWVSSFLGAAILAARGLRAWMANPQPVRITTLGVGKITGETGQTLLDAFHAQNQAHANLCSGRGRCGTCAVRILDGTLDLPQPTALEQATLDRVNYGPNVRLACQLPLLTCGALSVERILPPDFSFQHGPRDDITGTPSEVTP